MEGGQMVKRWCLEILLIGKCRKPPSWIQIGVVVAVAGVSVEALVVVADAGVALVVFAVAGVVEEALSQMPW